MTICAISPPKDLTLVSQMYLSLLSGLWRELHLKNGGSTAKKEKVTLRRSEIMIIREADIKDSAGIKDLYLQAFPDNEAELVSNLAIDLLHERAPVEILSLVAVENDNIIAHVAFSPVFQEENNKCFGYILAPLAVLLQRQKSGVGTSIVKHDLEMIVALKSGIVFVYGDPNYYCRFGFKRDLAQNFTPPYPLGYPDALLTLKQNFVESPDMIWFFCVESLSAPDLW